VAWVFVWAASERKRRYLAIALASCAVLLCEVAIARVLSVVLWYFAALYLVFGTSVWPSWLEVVLARL